MKKLQIDLDKALIRAKNGKKLINKIWEKHQNNNPDRIFYIQDQLEGRYLNLLSVELIRKKILKIFNVEAGDQINLIKTKVNKKTYDKLIEHDKKVLKLIKGNVLTDLKISKEISMLHFMIGSTIDDDNSLEDNYIYYDNNVIIKKDNKCEK